MERVFDLIRNSGLAVGMAVMSKTGHDAGRVYLVMNIQDRFAWLSDGYYRPAGKYKKKRIRHLKVLGFAAGSDQIEKIRMETTNSQADMCVRKLLREFIARQQRGL